MFEVTRKMLATVTLTLIALVASAQSNLMDKLAEDVELRFDWDAYRNDEARLAIEICTIGACDQFVASSPNLESFFRFVDFYVVFASGYVDFRSTSPAGRPPIPYIIERLESIDADDLLSSDCGTNLTPESISCTLESLAESLQIAKYFVRYDQGRNVVPEPEWVGAELSEERIAANLQRYASLDVSLPVSLQRNCSI